MLSVSIRNCVTIVLAIKRIETLGWVLRMGYLIIIECRNDFYRRIVILHANCVLVDTDVCLGESWIIFDTTLNSPKTVSRSIFLHYPLSVLIRVEDNHHIGICVLGHRADHSFSGERSDKLGVSDSNLFPKDFLKNISTVRNGLAL
ncbi:hypothetical protein C462_10677 [Halorubrum distributum JCM 13916]|uniref:Uncharacterized protein n=1 Tax=Halorubrum distributum JCM 13916 TaxID=1230455 RepID=M0PN87_9EURY|nr:hypothetical protein C462_10677 [Halorubrum arcis JCM 13916]